MAELSAGLFPDYFPMGKRTFVWTEGVQLKTSLEKSSKDRARGGVGGAKKGEVGKKAMRLL